MSGKTFIADAYPVSAEECPIEHALQHSIHKWERLSPEVLAEHGVRRNGLNIVNRTGNFVLGVDTESCALCVYFYSNDSCPRCLGANANGRICIDEYTTFLETGDTAPMLRWLRKALP